MYLAGAWQLTCSPVPNLLNYVSGREGVGFLFSATAPFTQGGRALYIHYTDTGSKVETFETFLILPTVGG